MYRTRTLALLAWAASGALLAAPSIMGSFSASVSGAVSAQLRGGAVFQDVAVTGDSAPTLMWISLGAGGDPNHRIQLSRKTLGAPAVGTYRITDSGEQSESAADRAPDEFGAMYERPAGGGEGSYGASSGTVEITSSTANRVSGRFSFTAHSDEGGGRITVTGQFTADRAEVRKKL